MKKYIIPGLIALAAALTACDDVFEPAPENNLPLDFLESNSSYAEGLLGVAYMSLPNGSFHFNEVATDDAVSNDATNSWRIIASGRWTAQNNPVNRWENCRSAIQYCNLVLDNIDRVTWAADADVNKYFTERFRAEALGLRAIFMYYLLQAHAGIDASGELMGIPIVEVPESASGSEFNVPRNTFVECMTAMKRDAQLALESLPSTYGPECYDEIRAKHPGITEGQLERVYGMKFTGRVCGKILDAYLARMALMAASPAYEKSGTTWEEAANLNAKVVRYAGGISGLDPNGCSWYCADNIDKLGDTESPAEVIWRTTKGNNSSMEEENFPPTLYGKGRINPTQNLVDAFPMANGYPITDANGGYSDQNPYADRDPRLAMYIIYNGAKAGINNKEINTSADGSDNDALDKISTSTRTGYYMKKHLNQTVNCDPSSAQSKVHYTARLRYTEFFLNYAEAANEAWGPLGAGQNGFSAYDVVKAIRQRAGVGLENGDAYLESIKGNKDAMRQLIRNERRIELCFEGFRFYDLRRWKENLNEPARGMNITAGEYKPFEVETRNYKDYMYYGPIPYSEVLKFSNLTQNAGW